MDQIAQALMQLSGAKQTRAQVAFLCMNYWIMVWVILELVLFLKTKMPVHKTITEHWKIKALNKGMVLIIQMIHRLMRIKYIKSAALIFCLIGNTVSVYSQRQYNIAFNGVKYNRGYIQCGILNKSDSAIKVSFKYIKKERAKEILKNYDISKDTLVFELMPEIIITVHSSQPCGYIIDGEPSDQRTIASYATLRVFVRMKRGYMHSLKYLKMILPTGEYLTEKIIR